MESQFLNLFIYPELYYLKKYGLYIAYLLLLGLLGYLIWKQGIRNILLGVFFGYLILFFLALIGQKYVIFFPKRAIKATPEDWGLNYQEIKLETPDSEQIYAWFIPGERKSPVILFCHGNSSNMSSPAHLQIMNIFNSLKMSAIIFDYRGFGKSSGSPDELGSYLDVETVWSYLVLERKFSPEDIVIWGRSLGGGVASYLAMKKKNCQALVLEASFLSVVDVARRLVPFLPLSIIIHHNYPVKKYISVIDCPILIFHSKDDETVPFAHGKKLFDLANEPKSFIELSGSHNLGFLVSKQRYIQGIQAFLELDQRSH